MKPARLNHIGVATPSASVIASEARQSSLLLGQPGLLRSARNDVVGAAVAGLLRHYGPRNDVEVVTR